MTNIDIKAIRARAEDADRGKWTVGERFDNEVFTERGGYGRQIATCLSVADAAHIAGLSPDVAIALCDEVERLRAALREHLDAAGAVYEAKCDCFASNPEDVEARFLASELAVAGLLGLPAKGER